MRLQQYEIFNNIITAALEHLIFFIILKMKNGKQGERLQQQEYHMLVKLHSQYIFTSYKKITEINHKTKLFFNEGLQ